MVLGILDVDIPVNTWCILDDRIRVDSSNGSCMALDGLVDY